MRFRTTDAGPRVRLADDDRGRVPFALVGVLLLVGSVTWTVALSQRGPPQVDADADDAMDRGESAVRTELRQAVARAGANAAQDPVIERADTEYGRVLSADAPYRDAFRIRAYRQAVRAFESVDVAVDDVRVDAELPPVTDPASMRAALDRVHVVERDRGVVRVTVDDVALEARTQGRTIERTERSVTVTVATPALTLHEWTGDFERQLERDALDGKGFERRLTSRLYAIAWARGYAQYGGGPIQDVLSNRHVELSANAALLQTQRTSVGMTDPAARAALGRATARVGATDLLAGAGYDGERWVDEVLGDHPAPVDDGGPIAEVIDDARQSDVGGEETTVRVGRSADDALYRLSTGRGGQSLDEVVSDVYAARARRIVDASVVDTGGDVEPPDPGANWTRAGTSTGPTRTDVTDADGGAASTPADWDEYAAYVRDVERTYVARAHWRHENGSKRTTSAERTETHRVTVSVVGDPADGEHAPTRTVDRLYERGGPAGGRNLAGVPEEAVERLVDDEGGPDAVAKAAVVDGLGDERITVERAPSDAVAEWIYRDLAKLREETRKESVTVERGRLATGANPTADLEARIEGRADGVRRGRQSYQSVAHRARAAARVAYLGRLADDLGEAANDVVATSDGVDETLSSAGAATGDRLESLLPLRNEVESADPRPTTAAPPAGDLRLSVDGAPAYLTLASVGRSEVSSLPPDSKYHPLAARTKNVFTVPFDSNPGGVVDEVFGDPETVGLEQGARALAAANGVSGLDGGSDDGADGEADSGALGESKDALREEISDSNDRLRGVALRAVREETSLDRVDRMQVVDRTLWTWTGSGERALAMLDGSVARGVAERAAEREETPSTVRFRDELRTRLLVELSDAAEGESVRLPNGVVGTAISETKRQARTLAEDAANRAQDRARQRIAERASTVPAGLPVTPIPGHWYATANVWQVDLSGEYARFRLDARHGTPVGHGAVDGTTSYVRDGTDVELDLTGDESTERLGTSTRVSFRANATVLVAVPPGKGGVGDLDGERTERSEGWPGPGFEGDPTGDGGRDGPVGPGPGEASDNA